MTTTTFELNGYQVVKHIGVIRGIVVRSRSIFGTLGGVLHTIIGGNIKLFTDLCERTREEAFDMMISHAEEVGANAVIGVRYDATGNGSNGRSNRGFMLWNSSSGISTEIKNKINI
jgi:uncharacterized protein YbjQ (UPF0145 family)